MRNKRGFTLLELMVVVVIIGILIAFAVPQFTKSKEHAIGQEAIATLKLIAAAEKIYRIEANAYYPIPPGTQTTISGTDCAADHSINACLRLSIPSGANKNWSYSVTGAANTFSATATRQSSDANYSQCIYSINNGTEDATPNKDTTYCP